MVYVRDALQWPQYRNYNPQVIIVDMVLEPEPYFTQFSNYRSFRNVLLCAQCVFKYNQR
jgi:hypothetical protein